MFRAFDEQDFWKEIREKDYLRLKVDVVSALLQDPTFARGEAKRALAILQKEVPEIFEQERHLSYESRRKEADWDKGYFTELTYWFQKNFALSRLPYIETVGKRVHADTEAAYNAAWKRREEAKAGERGKNPISASESRKKSRLPLLLGAAVLAALALSAIWFIK